MNSIESRITICGALLAVTLVSGFLMSRSGQSTNSLIFNVHKLIALGTVILLGVSAYGFYKTGGMHIPHVAIFAITGLFFLALIVSGGLLSLVSGTEISIDESVLQIALRIHQIVPVLVLVTSAISLYLLVNRNS